MSKVATKERRGVVSIGGAPSVVLEKYGSARVYGDCVFDRGTLLKWINGMLLSGDSRPKLDMRETAALHLLRAAITDGSPYANPFYYAQRSGKKGPSQLWAGWARMKHPDVPLNTIRAIDVGSGEIKVITPSGTTTFDAAEFYTLDPAEHQSFFNDLIQDPHFVIGTAKARSRGFSFAIAVEDEAYAEFEAADATFPVDGPIDFFEEDKSTPSVIDNHYHKGRLSFGAKSLQGVIITDKERTVYTTNVGTQDIVERIKENHDLGALTLNTTAHLLTDDKE